VLLGGGRAQGSVRDTSMMFDPTAPYDYEEVKRVFNRDVLPVLKTHGPEIGEKAMQGDGLAEQVIRRYAIWCSWLDPVNLKMLENLIHRWLKRRDAR